MRKLSTTWLRRGTALLGCLLAFAGSAALAQPSGKPLRKLTIAAGTQVLNSSYPYLMMPGALGYWAAEGLDVTVVPSGGSAQSIQQLVGRSAEFGEVNSSSLIQAAAGGTPVRAVMANTTVDWSLVSLDGGAVHSLADFKGRTIGVSSLGTGGIALLKAYLRGAGLDPDKDFSIQPVGFGGMALQALTSGRVDGLMYWASAIASFESAGAKLRYFRAPEWKAYADFSLIATDTTIKQEPAMVEAVVRAMAKASYFTSVNPDCARRLFWKQYPQLKASAGSDEELKRQFDLRQIEAGVKSMQEARALGTGEPWGVAPAAAYERMQQFMLETKTIAQPAAAGSLVIQDSAVLERANRFDHDAVRQAATACTGA